MNGKRPVVAADYVISVDDSGEVVAVAAGSGEELACGGDASAVIQAAIDDLPKEGGKVYLNAGCYWLSSTVRIKDKHGVHLEGAARGIVFSEGMEGTVLRSKEAIDLLEIFGDEVKVAGVTVSNLHLIGSGKDNGRAGLLVRGDSDLLSIYNVGAHVCGIGFYFKGDSDKGTGVIDAAQIQFCDPQYNGIGMKMEKCHYNKIISGEFSDCDEYGILLASPDSGLDRLQGVKIIGVTAIRSGKAGIFVGRNTEDVTIAGGADLGGMANGSGVVVKDEGNGSAPCNVIINGVHAYNNRDAGVMIDGGKHVIVQGCICSEHDHAVVKQAGQKHGVHIKQGSEDVVLNGNIVYGVTGAKVQDDRSCC